MCNDCKQWFLSMESWMCQEAAARVHQLQWTHSQSSFLELLQNSVSNWFARRPQTLISAVRKEWGEQAQSLLLNNCLFVYHGLIICLRKYLKKSSSKKKKIIKICHLFFQCGVYTSKFQQHNVPDIWCYRWLWGARNTWGRKGRLYFLYLLPRADAFSARNSVGSQWLTSTSPKPEWRGSSRGRVSCAGVPANVVLEVALVAPK